MVPREVRLKMSKTIIVGDFANAVGGVLTLRGGTASHLDTIYVLDLPDTIPPTHPVWTTSVHVLDGDGDAIVELSKGADVLDLGAGADWAKAGAGDDLVLAGPGEDLIMGGADDDLILGGSGDDILVGGWGIDEIQGGGGADTLYGAHDQDDLRGDDGRDALFGGGEDDVLRGGLGQDTLVGGHGADEFRVGALELDAVLDFDAAEGDTLVVDGVDRTTEADAWIGEGGVVSAPIPAAEISQVPASDGATG